MQGWLKAFAVDLMAGTQDGEPKIKNGHNCALDIYTLQEPILHEKENEKSREKH